MANAVPSRVSVAGATTALVLLTALNFVNYIDRYILPGVQEQIKGEFHISDGQLGSLTLWFMLAYMLSSPFTGWLGDRVARKPIIVVAALFWSGVNFFTASVHSFDSLNLRHAALGIGEATFGIFAPAVLADFYPEDQRNRVLTIFNIAIPVGAALGYLAGGTIGSHFGWRMSFICSAVPGVVIAVLIALLMKEPARGGSLEGKAKLEKGTVAALARNKPYLASVLGYAAVTFTIGGISIWMPTFLQRVDHRSQQSAAFIMGALTVGAGLLGTILGGAIAQRWSKTNRSALYLVPAWGALTALPFGCVCFFGPPRFILPSLALAIFLIFLGTGPVNASTLNAVPASVRATAMAGQLFLIHAFGDMLSSPIIGVVSDRTTLSIGLGVTLITLLLGSMIFFAGAAFVGRDQAGPPLQPA